MKAKQISDFENVQIVGVEKPKRRGGNTNMRKFGIIFFLLAAAVVSVICYFLITANRLSSASYHILILESASTTQKAGELSESVAKAGGSGYIINDGDFKICAAAYKSKADAEQVAERLKADYPNAHVQTYAFSGKKADKNLLAALKYPLELIDYVLEQSLNLDLAQTSEGSILLSVSAKRIELNNHLNTLKSHLEQSQAAQKAYEFYEKINSEWDYIGSLESDFGIYNHRLKYFSCLLIKEYAQLRSAL